MGRVAPLLAAGFEQTSLAKLFQEQIQQLLLHATGNQPISILAQYRKIEPGILQFQAQQVFPINPTANSIRSLPIRQVFSKLQNGDDCQPPRRFGRLPSLRKQSRKLVVMVECLQFIPQGHIGIALGKGSPSHAHGCLRYVRVRP